MSLVIHVVAYVVIAYFLALVASTLAIKLLPASAKHYIWNNWVAVDQWANTFAGGFPDETISSRTYKHALRGNLFAECLMWLIDLFDPGHGRRHVEWDEGHGRH